MSNLQRLLIVGLASAVVAVATGVPSPVSAESIKKYKQQINEYSSQLDALAEKDEWGISKEDRERARQWLDNARELLAQGNNETVARLVTQTADMIELIRASVRVRELEAMADDQEETYHKMKEERVPKLESEVEELKSQKEKLEEELEGLE